MVVGLARLTLHLPGSHSLKEKRMVLRSVKDRVRARANVAIAEVADNDLWQRGVLGVAVIGNDAKFVGQTLDEVVRHVRGLCEVTGVERQVESYREPLRENDLGFRYE